MILTKTFRDEYKTHSNGLIRKGHSKDYTLWFNVIQELDVHVLQIIKKGIQHFVSFPSNVREISAVSLVLMGIVKKKDKLFSKNFIYEKVASGF